VVAISCAWFDEFGCEWRSSEASEIFSAAHAEFVGRRLGKLEQAEIRRVPRIVSFGAAGRDRDAACRAIAEQLPEWMLALHADNHCTDPRTGKRISFGLVRCANIGPLIQIAQRLYLIGALSGFRFHLCVYHSRFPLI